MSHILDDNMQPFLFSSSFELASRRSKVIIIVSSLHSSHPLFLGPTTEIPRWMEVEGEKILGIKKDMGNFLLF